MKTIASLILAMFAAVAVNAHAASHAAGAPMKASEAKADKKSEAKKDEKKDAKKEEPKK